jgi:hypothetical protein
LQMWSGGYRCPPFSEHRRQAGQSGGPWLRKPLSTGPVATASTRRICGTSQGEPHGAEGERFRVAKGTMAPLVGGEYSRR